ncbi:MAG TPA: amidase [Steroidobacteraceae bacterium]|nr:amidase [Steroidobacteraceae bacterium]
MARLMALAGQLQRRALRSRELIERALARIADPAGEGARTFLRVYAAQARAQADAVDLLREAGASLPPLAGVPVSVKDLFDVAGEVTTAGSRVLRSRSAATQDAEVVSRLRRAGLIVVGRTNMTEFAYSGLGINPHYGTPRNPFERAAARIPGGSSSGAAVSVSDEMAAGALGTDTGGSCRIPAALTGLVGFKPTACRVPLEGVLPLSPTLDSVGPLGTTVECCALLDAVIAGESLSAPAPWPLRALRLLAPRTLVQDELETAVAARFGHAFDELARAGVCIVSDALEELHALPEINAKGGFSAAESYTAYGELLARHPEQVDPRVAVRILKGREQSAADYVRLRQAREQLIARLQQRTAPYDALIMPTVPRVAPRLEELQSDTDYFRANSLMLRNPAIANFLDRCAISLPIQEPGTAPIGLMLVGEHRADRRLLAIARGIETLLSPPAG